MNLIHVTVVKNPWYGFNSLWPNDKNSSFVEIPSKQFHPYLVFTQESFVPSSVYMYKSICIQNEPVVYGSCVPWLLLAYSVTYYRVSQPALVIDVLRTFFEMIPTSRHENWLTHWGRVTHICVSKLNIIRNKLKWNFNRNSNIFIQENALENVVCEMAFILSRPQCVDQCVACTSLLHLVVLWAWCLISTMPFSGGC